MPKMMTRKTPTSKRGYHVRCACCPSLVWLDTTHGVPPGPEFCSSDCYDEYWEA